MLKSILLVLGLIILSGVLIGCAATNVSIEDITLAVSPIPSKIYSSDLIRFKLTLNGFGLAKIKNTKIELEHLIVQKNSGKIIDSETETIYLKGRADLTRGIPALKLSPGEYRLITTAKSKDSTAQNLFEFQILQKQQPKPVQKEEGKFLLA